jgi:tetratricopeptide (TPR) repeat protein
MITLVNPKMKISEEVKARIARYRNFLQQDPNNQALATDLVDLLCNARLFEEALTCLEQLPEELQNTITLRKKKAEVLLSSRDFISAKSYIEQLLNCEAALKQDAMLLHFLGLSQYFLGAYESALDAFGNALGSSLAEANSTENLRSADNLSKRGGMTQTALGELDALATKYDGHGNIPHAELTPYIGLGQGNNPTIGALYDNEATQKGFVGTRLGAPPTNAQIDLPEFTVAPDLTVNVTGSSDMLYQAGRAIAVSGGVVAGMFQNIGDGIIGAGKLVYEGLQAQHYIMLGGDNSVNRYVPGYEMRQEAFENFKSYGSAIRTIASDPIQFMGNAIGHTFDGIQSKLSTAESTTELGDWFLYGASVGHATMGVATAVAGGVGLARSAVSGIGALRSAVGARIAARTAALDVSQNPFGAERIIGPLNNAELIAQRVSQNNGLRNSSKYAADMAKVGITDQQIALMIAKEAPLGFKSAKQFDQFKSELDVMLKNAKLHDAEIGLKGTSTTFYSENPGKRLGHHWDADPKNLGDYDLNITSRSMVERLEKAGVSPSQEYGVFRTRDIQNNFPELDMFRSNWSKQLGRDVNFVGYPKPVARDLTEYILRGGN